MLTIRIRIPPSRTTFTQLFYFQFRVSERLPLAIKRYQDELIRMYTVLEGVLKKQQELCDNDNEREAWLVGGRITVADLGFVMYVILRIPLSEKPIHEAERRSQCP